jgi:phosphosulfolactate synthase (CoM biosynthesis protein A)
VFVHNTGFITLQARSCVEAGAAAVVINAEDLMEGAAWDGAAIGRLLDAVGMEHLLLEAPHSQVCNISACNAMS